MWTDVEPGLWVVSHRLLVCSGPLTISYISHPYCGDSVAFKMGDSWILFSVLTFLCTWIVLCETQLIKQGDKCSFVDYKKLDENQDLRKKIPVDDKIKKTGKQAWYYIICIIYVSIERIFSHKFMFSKILSSIYSYAWTWCFHC